jgi:hypothetical protein
MLAFNSHRILAGPEAMTVVFYHIVVVPPAGHHHLARHVPVFTD